jgi:hypothetical protein
MNVDLGAREIDCILVCLEILAITGRGNLSLRETNDLINKLEAARAGGVT